MTEDQKLDVASSLTGRRAQVLRLLQDSPSPLDDDQIAQAIGMNRVYVNSICRQLEACALIVRQQGANRKLVNAPVAPQASTISYLDRGERSGPTRRRRKLTPAEQEERIKTLIADFPSFVDAFEANQAFPGPSLYFHERAIERRRKHSSVKSLLADLQFLETVYAVLPAWGMHRMGSMTAKVADLTPIVAALSERVEELEKLWPIRITELGAFAAGDIAAIAWDIIAHARVSTSRTQIVAGSKFLHHFLPDLIPPIDREYTFVFFSGCKQVRSDKAAFLDWFPRMARIAAASHKSVADAIRRSGFMATGEAKVIDNAIMGYIQTSQRNSHNMGIPQFRQGL